MPIEKTSTVTAKPTAKTPAPNAGIEPVMAAATPEPTPETPKKGKKGPRGPRGESFTWDASRIKALRRTARKIVSSGRPLTPILLTSEFSQVQEVASQRHLLEGTGGVTRVVNKYTAALDLIAAARAEGRDVPEMPSLAGVGSLRVTTCWRPWPTRMTRSRVDR